jgi:hypothetical protein
MSTEQNKSHVIEVAQQSKNKQFKAQPVKIIDFDMPFGSMVTFMIKWVLASIPGIIILFIVGIVMSLIFISIFGTILISSFSQY